MSVCSLTTLRVGYASLLWCEYEKPRNTPKPGTPAEVKEAMRTRAKYQLVAKNRETAAEPLNRVAVTPKVTLSARAAVDVQSMRVAQLNTIFGTKAWRMPRTFDPMDEGSHFAHFYEHLQDKEYREAVSAVVAGSRHPVIPPPMQDILF